MNVGFDLCKKLTWTLGALSVTSCLARNDYNIVFSILVIMILANFYNQKPQGCSKIITHLMLILIFADILWLIFFTSAWIHEKNSKDSPEIAEYWDSLSFIHSLVYFLSIIELIIKIVLIWYFSSIYREKRSLKELCNFNYNEKENTPGGNNFGDGIERLDGNNFDDFNGFNNNFGNDY